MTTNNFEFSGTHADQALPTDHPLVGCEAGIDQIIECGQLFHGRGWSVGTSSNYSVVVDPATRELAVTASGKDKGRLSRRDFVRIGPDGKPTSPGQPKSSAETMLHVVLARDEAVGSILHTHSVFGTLLSEHFRKNGGIEITGFEMLKGLDGITTHEANHWVPIYDNTQDIPQLAQRIESDLASPSARISHGFLIHRHGLYTWGKDVFSARRHIEIYEFLFEVLWREIASRQ